MNVNEKGNLGLLKVITDLYSKGFTCFTPFDDYNPVDYNKINFIFSSKFYNFFSK